jgi:DNA repair protein RecO
MEMKGRAILLKKVPYLGESSILTLFSLDEGLISVFAKNRNHQRLANPFCLGEWVYRKGKKDLSFLIDVTISDSFNELKSNFDTITAAGAIAQIVLESQYPGKTSPLLFTLLHSYLKKLGECSNMQGFIASFYLKLILHEGLSTLTPDCTECTAMDLNEEEWTLMQNLGFVRQFSILNELKISEDFFKKIERLTNQLIKS